MSDDIFVINAKDKEIKPPDSDVSQGDSTLNFYKVKEEVLDRAFKDNDVINHLVNKIITVVLNEDKDPISAIAEARAYAKLIRKDSQPVKIKTPNF